MNIGLILASTLIISIYIISRKRRNSLKKALEEQSLPENSIIMEPTVSEELKAEAETIDEVATPSFETMSSTKLNVHEHSFEDPSLPKPQLPSKVLVIYLMAKSGKRFVGYELLQALIATGLRFGKMQIFHRYESSNGKGPILFSVASAVKPGTFDIGRMGTFSCPGLTLFMDTKCTAIPRIAFEALLTVAYQLAEDLNGDLFDANREPWTMEHEEAYWTMINQCEQEQMSLDLPVE